ncbi:transmembrane protein 246-like [Plakobranchus ocellatus]|uniref:Transmembrane protein 246-like n=1 Tax=Plakobranchus ocellatus TaxID=259542 RepID=A0AAV4B2K2_9GAST|nr:transmembrane protein 246-like [Plakobranchus ocellatus]
MLFLSYILPFSQLYRILHNYDILFKEVEAKTEIRLQEAQDYFKAIDPQVSMTLYKDRLSKGNIQFAFGVVSVKRKPKEFQASHKNPAYLIHTLALVDKVMKESTYFENSVPFVCNVDLNPQEHSDAVGLYTYLPYTERYGNNSLNAPSLTFPDSQVQFKTWKDHKSKYNKETVDYSFCLMTAALLKPKYVILLEDDTVPHSDFPVILEHLIESRLKYHSKYAYLKLYFPPKWQGFALELSTVIDLVLWGFITTSTVYLCLVTICKCRPPFSYEIFVINFSNHCLSLPCKINIPLSGKAFIFFYIICIFTIWLIGRQNIEALRRHWRYFYRLERAEGCCTQAQMYPSEIVDALSRYLLSVVGSTHTDLAISDFAAEEGLPTWQVEPNLFFHHGLHTTLNAKQKHPEEFLFNL